MPCIESEISQKKSCRAGGGEETIANINMNEFREQFPAQHSLVHFTPTSGGASHQRHYFSLIAARADARIDEW